MKISKTLCLCLGLSLSGFALSEDALTLYNNRGMGANDTEKLVNTEKALAAYWSLDKADPSFESFNKLGDLSIYAALLDRSDIQKRRKVLSNCIDRASQEIDKRPSRQEPYYYYIACIGAKAKIVGDLARGLLAIKLNNIRGRALDVTKVDGSLVAGYKGGGILRIFVGVESNPKARLLGLYNPDEAVEFSLIASKAAERSSGDYPDTLNGEKYFDNMYYAFGARAAKASHDKNKDALQDTIDAATDFIDSVESKSPENRYPAGREPESERYLEMTKQMLAKFERCNGEEQWIPCIDKDDL